MNAEELFKDNLKALRLGAGKSQVQVSADLRVPLNTYRSWEYGTVTPKYHTLNNLSAYFEVSIHTMLTVKISVR